MLRDDRLKKLLGLCASAAKRTDAKADQLCEKAFPDAPKQVKNTIMGAGTGLIIGSTVVGGIGIAAMGGAVGIPGSLVLAGVGGLLGNRLGVGQDKKAAFRNRQS
jgi:hypothetical protein